MTLDVLLSNLPAVCGVCTALAAVLMTVVQITPIRVNPWSTLARVLGRAINREVMEKLAELEKNQAKAQQKMDLHIKADDERDANQHRKRILQFNTDLIRGFRHTKEDFDEINYDITYYEHYCATHPDYSNNRAVQAIGNINRVYAACMDPQNEAYSFL